MVVDVVGISKEIKSFKHRNLCGYTTAIIMVGHSTILNSRDLFGETENNKILFFMNHIN
jgi:hypothetical protein